MNSIEIHFDDVWISFSSLLEGRVKLHLSHFERMLSRHLHLPFVKYGLVDDGRNLAILAQIPRERLLTRRFPEVGDGFSRGSLWYRALCGTADESSTKEVKPDRRRVSRIILREAEKTLYSTCEDNAWQLSERRPKNFIIRASDSMPASSSALWGNSKVEVHFAREAVSFMIAFLDAVDLPMEVSRAMRLWMMRVNGSLNYIRIGFSRKRVVFQVSLPLEGLSITECREAVHALAVSHSELSSEARALTTPEVASTYLEETASDYFHKKSHERR